MVTLEGVPLGALRKLGASARETVGTQSSVVLKVERRRMAEEEAGDGGRNCGNEGEEGWGVWDVMLFVYFCAMSFLPILYRYPNLKFGYRKHHHTFDEMTHFDLNLETHQLDLKDENARWIKRRRFKKGTEEYILRKREIRLQNRISARKSIEKKQAHIRELEVKVSKLKAETEFRKRVAQIFPNSKPAGRLCRLRRAFSMSDFYFPTQVAAEEANQLGEPVGRYPANYEKIS